MKNKYLFNKLYLLITLSLSTASIFGAEFKIVLNEPAMTYNGHKLNTLVNEEGQLTIKANPVSLGIVLRGKDTALEAEHLLGDSLNLSKLQACGALLKKEFSNGISEKNLIIGTSMKLYGGRLSGEESIEVALNKFGETLCIDSYLINSPAISLTGKKICLHDCFLVNKPKKCIIKSGLENSFILGIEINFSDSSRCPHSLSGTLDFETGTIDGEFFFFGVDSVVIHFN